MSQQLLVINNDTYLESSPEKAREYVTMRVGGQLFAIPVHSVRDVLRGLKVTRIPLASAEVVGALNLRGRVVTAISLRQFLGLPKLENEDVSEIMSVVVEYKNEFFSLIVDAVGEVIDMPVAEMEELPANMSGNWKEIAAGIYKLTDELLIVIDIQKLLKF